LSGIAVYMEGGGGSTDSKAAIRLRMAEFLREVRDQARSRRWQWKVVACGSGDAARDAFNHAIAQNPDVFNVLLVDSETAVNGTARAHLQARGWHLEVAEERIHLMVQTMETWIVADVATLTNYYGQGFRPTVLPQAADLETVAKTAVANALEHATRDTQKGPYHKIHHASALLKRIDPAMVMQRCRHCGRLFEILTGRLQGA